MKHLLFVFIAIIFSQVTVNGQVNSSVFISADELFENVDDYSIIDVSKADQYQEHSIISAQNIPRAEFTKKNELYGGLIASKTELETVLGNFGFQASDKIVIYDHKGGSDAGKLWWILTDYGHSDVRLLNGGFNAWAEKNYPLNIEEIDHEVSSYQFPAAGVSKIRRIELEEIKNSLNQSNTVIIDTRSFDEYEGNIQKEGAFKKGRIPGSIHIDWAENIDYHGNKLMLGADELLSIYESKGVTKDKNVIVYCHSGSRSSLTAIVLSELLGYENVSNYDGSWIEWSYHNELPIEGGEIIEASKASSPTYSEVFWSGFKNFGNYTWNEITFNVNPWYINYFWWLVILSLFVWGLEIAFPWRKDQPIFRKDFWIDAFFMFFNFYIFKLIIFMSFSEVSAKFFHELIGGDVNSLALFDMSAWPIVLQLLVFFIATDFIQWGTHVMLHRFNFLWRFHKVHHSIEQMGFAGHLRYHWMENVFYTPMKYIMVMLIGGFTPEMAYIVFYISIAIGHFNHANIGWSYGPLKYLINNPKMHIWHHAKDLPHERRYGVNFGISLSIWDYLFGKSYIPKDGRDIELGFEGMDKYPRGFFSLIFSGFKKPSSHKE